MDSSETSDDLQPPLQPLLLQALKQMAKRAATEALARKLIDNADRAMYYAKLQGGNRHQCYDPSFDARMPGSP